MRCQRRSCYWRSFDKLVNQWNRARALRKGCRPCLILQLSDRYPWSVIRTSFGRLLGEHHFKMIFKKLNTKKIAVWNFSRKGAKIDYTSDDCDEIKPYDLSQDYFRFAFASDLQPTNNHSEQQIRHCVIDRKITQGTRSEAGQRYNEGMWTAIATCKKQNRNFFSFLKESIEARLKAKKPPSLLNTT